MLTLIWASKCHLKAGYYLKSWYYLMLDWYLTLIYIPWTPRPRDALIRAKKMEGPGLMRSVNFENFSYRVTCLKGGVNASRIF